MIELQNIKQTIIQEVKNSNVTEDVYPYSGETYKYVRTIIRKNPQISRSLASHFALSHDELIHDTTVFVMHYMYNFDETKSDLDTYLINCSKRYVGYLYQTFDNKRKTVKRIPRSLLSDYERYDSPKPDPDNLREINYIHKLRDAQEFLSDKLEILRQTNEVIFDLIRMKMAKCSTSYIIKALNISNRIYKKRMCKLYKTLQSAKELLEHLED